MRRITLAFLGLVLLQAPETANAQALTEADAKVAQILRENPDHGILIADVSMRNENGTALACGTLTLGTVASLKQFAPVTFAKARKSPFIMLTALEKKEGLMVPKPQR